MLKKIVYIITKSEIGGAQKWIKEQKDILSDSFDIYLITSEPGWLTKHFSDDHVYYVKDILSFKSISASYEISKILKKIDASVVISNSANAGVHGRIAKLYHNHRSIYVSHGWSCTYNGGKLAWAFCFVEKILAFLSDNILCVSEKDFDKAITQIGIPGKKLTTITNGIIPLPSREFSYISKGKLKFVFVGRMIHPKRPDLLLDVISQLPEVEIDLIGDGPMLSVLKSKYGNLPNINFLGVVESFEDFNKYDVFVLTSESEGLPMSALEAASAGLPLLLSDVGGCNELIDDENPNGILYKNDVDSLRNAIEKFIAYYPRYQYFADKNKGSFSLLNKHNEYVALING